MLALTDGGDGCGTHRCDRQRRAARGGGRATAAARLLPARAAGPDRDERGLRHLLVRRVHGAPRGRVGQVVHGARRSGRRLRGNHDRGARARRRAPPRPESLPRAARAPVRLLHTGDGAGGGQPLAGAAEPERARDPAGTGGQPLPLHGLPQHRARGAGGRGGTLMAAIGTPVPRKEDPELLTGQAHYVDDLTVPGMIWMALVRSPYAHAQIKVVDVSKALAAEGVVAAYSGEDLAGDIPAGLPCAWPVTEDINMPTHWPLARDKARYAGDAVAVVLAKSRALAKDAAELVEVEYEPLPAVTDVEKALAG